MRMRGYHSTNNKEPGYEKGLLLNTYYYSPPNKKEVTHRFATILGAFFMREFPVSWRGLDDGIGYLPGLSLNALAASA
jgi:hypothetical protein